MPYRVISQFSLGEETLWPGCAYRTYTPDKNIRGSSAAVAAEKTVNGNHYLLQKECF